MKDEGGKTYEVLIEQLCSINENTRVQYLEDWLDGRTGKERINEKRRQT